MNLLRGFLVAFSILLIGCSASGEKKDVAKKVKQNGIILSHESGHYASPFSVELKPSKGEGKIIYTLDGSLPLEGSKSTFIYQEPISIKKIHVDSNDLSFIPTTYIPEKPHYETWIAPQKTSIKGNVLRAQLILPDGTKKDVVTKTYFVDGLNLNLPEIYLTIDSAALFDNDTGIYIPGVNYKDGKKFTGNYFKRGKDWEREAQMTYLSKENIVEINQNIGVRVHGMASPKAPLKTIRLCARKKYGKGKLKFNPYESSKISEFKFLLLRTPYSTWNRRLFADQLVQKIVSDLDLEVANSIPVTLYINGEYWGLMDMAERMDDHYFEGHFKVHPDSLCYSDAAKSTVTGKVEFADVYDFAEQNDLSIPKNYTKIENVIDIDNYIDYIVIETFLGNRDWPGNNNERWRASGISDKWRWILIDMDAIMLDKDYRMLEKLMDTTKMENEHRLSSTLFFRKLVQNQEFKSKLLKRYEELMSTTLCPERLLKIFEEYEKIYENDVQRQIDRWSMPQSKEIYEQKNEKMKDFIRERSNYMVQDIEEQLGVKINPVCK